MDSAQETKLKLHTLLAPKPWNEAVMNGQVSSPIVEFDFEPTTTEDVNKKFKPFVRELAYDCGELAFVTYLQAHLYKKPLVLLPFVVSNNLHHKRIIYNSERGELKPSDLVGKRVGVRTYAQTTPTWVRGVLQNEYGVDLDKVTWVTSDEGHLTEYTDPPNCERAPKGKKLQDMLGDGEIDAAIADWKDPRFKQLIPDADKVAKEWATRLGIAPINHMFVVKKEISEKRPDVVREIYRVLEEGRAKGPAPSGLPMVGGVEPNRKTLELLIEYAYQQKLIPHKIPLDELFDDTTRALGR